MKKTFAIMAVFCMIWIFRPFGHTAHVIREMRTFGHEMHTFGHEMHTFGHEAHTVHVVHAR